MKGLTKWAIMGAIVFGINVTNVAAKGADTQKTPAEKSTKFVEKLDKKVDLSEKQQKKIHKIKTKELEKVAKLQSQIDKLRLQSKDKVDKTLTKKQRVQLEAGKNKNKSNYYPKGKKYYNREKHAPNSNSPRSAK